MPTYSCYPLEAIHENNMTRIVCSHGQHCCKASVLTAQQLRSWEEAHANGCSYGCPIRRADELAKDAANDHA